ncbi:uncharacterized protein LOC129804193 [Phlebotomus papatasi]|uniref:uncharacterized protein LOC129804193 n=1 Tax=Phlebotomus papatasi TaxID=29031 RepID=UPI002484515E|nr:uncharacterized protein LOC129804193 [Phlebotomus papatasi]
MSEIPPELDTSLADSLHEHLSAGRVKEALDVTADNRFHACLKSNCSDTIRVLTEFLTTKTFNENPEVYGACEDILKTVTSVAAPQEVLLELMAAMEESSWDQSLFKSLLKALQLCILRLPENKILSIDHALNAVFKHVVSLSAESTSHCYSEERQKVLESDKEVTDFLTRHITLTLFLEPLREEFIKVPLPTPINFPEKSKRSVLIKFLMKLLGKGSFPKLHLKAEETPINTYTRQCSGFYVDSITDLLGGDPFSILPWIEERFRWSGKKDKKTFCIFLNEVKIPSTSLMIFFYVIFVGKQIPSQSPKIYSPIYIFEIILYLITSSLENPYNEVKMKAVELLQASLENLELKALKTNHLELQIHANLCLSLTNLMIYNESEDIRKTSIDTFRSYLRKFDDEGRFVIIEKLFDKYQHDASNFRGFLTTQFKDFVAEILTTEENRFPVQDRFDRIFNRHLTTLRDRETTDLVQEAEAIIASLNTIRFLALRDLKNCTSFWDRVPELHINYLHHIRKSLDLGRAHYEAEKIKIENNEDEDISEKISVNIREKSLPKLSKKQKLFVMNNSLMKLDLIESVLARVNECLNNVPEFLAN